MVQVACPRCGTPTEKPAVGSPVCTKCGYGAKAAAPARPPAQANWPGGASGGARSTGATAGWGAGATTAMSPTTGTPSRMSGGAPENGPPVPGRLRPVPVGKTILLGIVTLGIYVAVRSFKCGGDLHRMPGGWGSWKLVFWLQLVPYLGTIFALIYYFKNNKQANALRKQAGLDDSYLPFILACIPIVNIAAPFVWASHYNELAQRT